MSETQKNSGTFQLLKLAVATLLTRRIMLLPFAITAFIQLFILEILYFLPQPPLSRVFSPIISKLWAEEYLHYPMNFVLLPKLFQYAQIPIYIFISSFFICVAIGMLIRINNGQAVTFRQVVRDIFRESYIHIFVAAALSIIIVFIFYKFFGVLYLKAQMIKTISGPYFWIKAIIIGAAPAINMLMSIVVTTLFAYVLPVIVIEKKKLLSALGANFKHLFRYPWRTFLIVFIPSLFFVPILLIRNFVSLDTISPEASVLVLASTIIVMVAIDAIVYTAIAVHMLTEREQ